MVKRSTREIIFFIIAFLLFFLAVRLGQFWIEKGQGMNSDIVYIIIGLVYTLSLLAIHFLAKLKCSSSEGFWDVSPFAKCKGTEYMWQGDSDESKMCRELASTSEGRCGISSYNCPKGYSGQPMLPFYYTPISDDSWTNERCDNASTCPCKDTGLCSMEAQRT
jgi:hypothetical protein